MTPTTMRTRWAARLLVGGLVLAPLAACSGESTVSSGTASSGTASSGTASSAVSSSAAMSSGATSSSGSGSGASASSSCSGNSCSLTLSGANAKTQVLGTTISVQTVSGEQATLSVGDRSVSCRQGETVSAGPVRLQCTTVSADRVVLSASLG